MKMNTEVKNNEAYSTIAEEFEEYIRNKPENGILDLVDLDITADDIYWINQRLSKSGLNGFINNSFLVNEWEAKILLELRMAELRTNNIVAESDLKKYGELPYDLQKEQNEVSLEIQHILLRIREF